MLFGLEYNDILIFLLFFARILTAMTIFPILGSQSVPIQVKIGISIVLAMLLFSVLHEGYQLGEWSPLLFILNICKEVVVGLLLGFIPSLLFAGIELAGHLIAIQIGLGIVNVYDPQTQAQVSIIGQFQVFAASMFFLAINGHHLFIEGIYQSYRAVPLVMLQLESGLFDFNMDMAGNLFIAAVKVGAPLIVSLLLTSVALGLVARAVPQMNVFFVGMPLKIGVGFLILAASMPIFAYVFQTMVDQFEQDLLTVLKILSV